MTAALAVHRREVYDAACAANCSAAGAGALERVVARLRLPPTGAPQI
jgi:hypothetical protein